MLDYCVTLAVSHTELIKQTTLTVGLVCGTRPGIEEGGTPKCEAAVAGVRQAHVRAVTGLCHIGREWQGVFRARIGRLFPAGVRRL